MVIFVSNDCIRNAKIKILSYFFVNITINPKLYNRAITDQASVIFIPLVDWYISILPNVSYRIQNTEFIE